MSRGYLKRDKEKAIGTECHYCHRPIIGRQMTIDHKIPKTKGGSEDPSNKVWSCQLCNGIKSNMDYEEFLSYLAALPIEDIKKIQTFPFDEVTGYTNSYRRFQSHFARKYNKWKATGVIKPMHLKVKGGTKFPVKPVSSNEPYA